MRSPLEIFVSALRLLREGPGAMREAVERSRAREAAMEYAVRHPGCTAADCAAALRWDPDKAREYLNELCGGGFLVREDGDPPRYRLKVLS